MKILDGATGNLKTYALDYHDGERFPHLERDSSKPDLLQQIVKPLGAAGK